MKRLVLALVLGLGLVSCNKAEITPNPISKDLDGDYKLVGYESTFGGFEQVTEDITWTFIGQWLYITNESPKSINFTSEDTFTYDNYNCYFKFSSDSSQLMIQQTTDFDGVIVSMIFNKL